MDATGVASIIAALAGLVSAAALAWNTIKSAKTIKDTHSLVVAVDHAVNGKPPGAQTLSEDVVDIHKATKEK